MNILNILFGILIYDLLPVCLITLILRKLFKRKISKGWCILVFICSVLCTSFLAYITLGNFVKLGFIDYAVHFIVIKQFLYDSSIISIFDTEKQIKEKREKQEQSSDSVA